MKAKFDAFTSFFPSFYTSSSKAVNDMVSSITMNECEYLYKTQHTEKEIMTFLTSKMEMEIIYGLKIIIIDTQNSKDITIYIPRIFEIFIMVNDYYIKRLCLAIIDHVTLAEKKSEVMLWYNIIPKIIKNPNVLNRLNALKAINDWSNQDNSTDAFKELLPFTSDSNPLLRRITLLILVKYAKSNSELLSIEEMNEIIKKYLNDSNPLVVSTGLLALVELRNSDYLSIGWHNNFERICKLLKNVDDFYYEHCVFALVNFSKIFLLINLNGNYDFIQILFNTWYNGLKCNTIFARVYSCLSALYEIWCVWNGNDCQNWFKDKNKRIDKISKHWLKFLLQSKTDNEKYLSLELIIRYWTKQEITAPLIETNNNPQSSQSIGFNYFYFIKNRFKEQYYSYWAISASDINTEYIYVNKLKALSLLVTSSNAKSILEIVKASISYPNQWLQKHVITIIYEICKNNLQNKQAEIVQLCTQRLIDWWKINDDNITTTVIVSLCKLINEIKEEKKYVWIYSIKNYKKSVSTPFAKSNIINMISKNIDIIPTVAIDFYRRVLLDIDTESNEVKLQILHFTLRIHNELKWILASYKSEEISKCEQTIKWMTEFALSKMEADNCYLIREKARIVKVLIASNIVVKKSDIVPPKGNTEENEEKDSSNVFIGVIGNDTCNSKYKYDAIDESMKEKMKTLALKDLINIQKQMEMSKSQYNKESCSGINDKKTTITDSDKYSSCQQQSTNINSNISNINSGLDIAKTKEMWKNKLDEFLNNDDDEDDDDYEVEIKKRINKLGDIFIKQIKHFSNTNNWNINPN